MYSEQQYQRDIARIEAHKLDLKDQGFMDLLTLVQREVRERALFLQRRGAPIVLQSGALTVANKDKQRAARFIPNAIRHQIEARGVGIDYTFTVVVDAYQSPVLSVMKYGSDVGVMDEHTIIAAIHDVVDSITDLPRPIV